MPLPKDLGRHFTHPTTVSTTDSVLGETEDMNTLIQNSIWLNVPIGQLENHKPIKTLRDRGTWTDNQIAQIKLLKNKFETIANHIIERCI